ALPDPAALSTLAMAPEPAADTGTTDPVLATARQQAALAEAEWRMERSQWAPSLLGGAVVQRIDGVFPYKGYILGTSIPLPGSGQGARTKAARLRSEIALQQVDQLQRARATELAATRAQWAQLRESLNYYEGTGAALANTLRNDAGRAYRNGEVGYVEFLQGMDQARTIEEGHLAVRFQLGLAHLHVIALMGL
ncbi:MAG: TolC family protein, partial [Bacteroidetes bacterium]|nr:TolC family protein [Bacteroidota bacterium]